MIKAPVYIYVVLALLVVTQTVFYYPQLPDTVASHFDGSGRANGWSSKETFFLIYFGVFLLTTVIFLLLPSLLKRMPKSLINMPNKHYWLAEERKEQTLIYIKQKMNWFGIVTMLLLICVIQLAIAANLHPAKRLSALWLLLGTYYFYVIIWIITFIIRLRKRTIHP